MTHLMACLRQRVGRPAMLHRKWSLVSVIAALRVISGVVELYFMRWSVASFHLRTQKHRTFTRKSWLENSNYRAFSPPIAHTSSPRSFKLTQMIGMESLRFVNTPGTVNLETSSQWACSQAQSSCLLKTLFMNRFSTSLVSTLTIQSNVLKLIGTITLQQHTTCSTSVCSASRSLSQMWAFKLEVLIGQQLLVTRGWKPWTTIRKIRLHSRDLRVSITRSHSIDAVSVLTIMSTRTSMRSSLWMAAMRQLIWTLRKARSLARNNDTKWRCRLKWTNFEGNTRNIRLVIKWNSRR